MALDRFSSRVSPKLAEVLASVLTNHKIGSIPADVQVRHLANWTTLTALGSELGDTFAGLYAPVLQDLSKLPSEHARILSLAASGEHQGYSIGMGTAVGVAMSPFSALFNNLLAPAVYALVEKDPQLIPDVTTLVGLRARGQMTDSQFHFLGRALGYQETWLDALLTVSYSWPSVAELITFRRRGFIGDAGLTDLLKNIGVPPQIYDAIQSQRWTILSPADLALAVLRGALTYETAQPVAEGSGIRKEDFDTLIANTGEPPGLAELLLLWRRGQIETTDLDRGIRQSRVRDEWIDTVHKLAIIPPSQAEALDARVKNQTTPEEAHKRFVEAGGDPDWYDIALGTVGESPTPGELGMAAFRGIIPWEGSGPNAISFAQGISESHYKDKWEPVWRQIAVYLPPPRTIVAMVRDGSMHPDEALDLLQKQGLTKDLATEYVTGASNGKLASHKQLLVTNIQSLYEEQGIDAATATALLKGEGYTDAEVGYLLWIWDFNRLKKAFDAGVTRIQSLFTGHKIDHNAASQALDGLHVPANQRDALLAIWAFTREANVKELTPAQIKAAWKKNLYTDQQALDRLTAQGYTATDADVFLNL